MLISEILNLILIQTAPLLCSDGEIPLSVNYKELDLRTLGDEVSGSNLVKVRLALFKRVWAGGGG